MMLKLGHFGNRKYVGSVQMWCRRWMEKISWTDSVKNEVLRRVKGERNILHEINKKQNEG
jgi:hypothetical protein